MYFILQDETLFPQGHISTEAACNLSLRQDSWETENMWVTVCWVRLSVHIVDYFLPFLSAIYFVLHIACCNFFTSSHFQAALQRIIAFKQQHAKISYIICRALWTYKSYKVYTGSQYCPPSNVIMFCKIEQCCMRRCIM